MPPQWQGSEDILVPPPGELEAEEEEEEEEEESEENEEGGVDGGVCDNGDGDEHREENVFEKTSEIYSRDRELPDSEDELAL